MKKILSAIACCLALTSQSQFQCVDDMAGTYPCHLVDLMRFMPLSQIGGGTLTNDIWGWVSTQTGKEYALVGCNNGTAFLDLSDPVNPVYLGLLPTHTTNSLWRDIETRGNYAFIVSEADGHGLQVFDMSQLDLVTNPPVDFEETTHFNGFGHAHTLNIDQESGYLYAMGTGYYNGGLYFVDINDPLNPTGAGGFDEGGYTHDGYAISYTGPDPDYIGHELVMACNGYNGLYVVDVTDKTDPQQVFSLTYPDLGYTHQGWFSKDFKYFMVDDELDENNFAVNQRTHIFHVEDLDNVQYDGFHQTGLNSIDHNLYVEDQFLYQANYTSGVRILDISRVSDAIFSEVGYFDVLPNNGNKEYKGTWSNYPYLPSGLLLATSMYEGCFILKPTLFALDQDTWSICGEDQIILSLGINAELINPLLPGVEGLPGTVTADAGGDIVSPEQAVITLSGLSTIPAGSYDFNLLLITSTGSEYEIPLHLNVAGNAPVVPGLSFPTNAANYFLNDDIPFSWEADAGSNSYIFQLASDANFATIVDEQTVDVAEYNPLFDLPAGTYYWRVRSVNDCGQSSFSEEFSFTVIDVSVTEQGSTFWQIYPNPTDGMTHIASAQMLGQLRLSDAAGKLCAEWNLGAAHTAVIDLSGLEPGFYMLTGQSGTVPLLVQ